MSHAKVTARKYVPEKVHRLQRLTEHVERLRTYLSDLGEDITLDLIDGWTTGDQLLDFVLLSCNGVYDPFVFSVQYRRLFDLGLRKPGQRVLVVQKAEHLGEDGPIIIRNIYLAVMRRAELELDSNAQVIRLPVEPNYFLWREFLFEGLVFTGHKIVTNQWLPTGPLYNEYCDYGTTRKEKDEGILYVPEDAVCAVELLPEADKLYLFEEHGIDADHLDELHTRWIRERSST